ncbi:GNAT family N-acetyltransferase [Stenotrophomonas maltophilia]|nr:GNAT family N-acetyltransferase [Stenotrophomonas maltophilia]MBA0279714.1 GNAT family N-acetyltransferase [Stenotrophomonas maltophilia]MBA0343638.1 GNAT family N-acetyltransferase [Stenotrophomonas maltophilia]MBA0355877.1 GNAT family N-acetyltransferase [Stenotrophomonas maltophilia]MBA0517898.1 GNAT family N-acetyltransferase [Stenotrophomonas maltophilia]
MCGRSHYLRDCSCLDSAGVRLVHQASRRGAPLKSGPPARTTSVAALEGRVAGMYKLGANFPDLGAHVASATYVVDPRVQGRGIGRALAEHSLDRARSEGFLAMQLNYVVSTNAPAVELYRKLGFAVVGTLPAAFRHRTLGLVDVYVMHRFL